MDNNENKAVAVKENNSGFQRIPLDKRQSTMGIAFIWMGSVVCIPVLTLGATLITQVNLTTLILFSLIGFALQALLVSLNGIAGADQGLPLSVLMGSSFGEKGSRVLGSLIIAINVTGSFALQTIFCATAFCAMLQSVWSITFPFWLAAILWGTLMVVTAIIGMDAMKWLSYVAMPLLLIVSIYAAIKAGHDFGGFSALLAFQPEGQMSKSSVLSILLGLMAGAAVICADVTRFAKSRKAVISSTAIGFLPTAVVFIALGAIMGMGFGTGDISAIFVELGLPIWGLLGVILATWTTNVTNIFSSGLALTRLFGWGEKKVWLGTLIGGVIGIGLSLVNLEITSFFDFMGVVVCPFSGVMVADYWIVGRGKAENWGIRKGFNWAGIVAALCGAAMGLLFPNFLNKSINSIVVAMVVYVICFKIAEKTHSIAAVEKFD